MHGGRGTPVRRVEREPVLRRRQDVRDRAIAVRPEGRGARTGLDFEFGVDAQRQERPLFGGASTGARGQRTLRW